MASFSDLSNSTTTLTDIDNGLALLWCSTALWCGDQTWCGTGYGIEVDDLSNSSTNFTDLNNT